MRTIPTEDKIKGLLFGLAAGDQIGGPIRMALQLSRALLDSDEFNEKNILRHYYGWWREAGFDTGYVANSVFMHMKHGSLNREAVKTVHDKSGGMTGGCNPMHRASPLALLKSACLDDLSDFAKADAKLTHFDPIAGECSRFVVLTCRRILDGADLHTALTQTYADLPDDSSLKSSLRDVITFDKSNPMLTQPLSNIGYSPDVLRATIYILKNNDTFTSTLESAFAFAGAGNYCPVIVGAIAGIYYGYSQIPQSWLRRHQTIADELSQISQQFVNLWTASP